MRGLLRIRALTQRVVELPKVPTLGVPPVAFEHKHIGGQNVRFSEYYNGKLVLLDFWATWCGPCIKELPSLLKVYEEFHEKGFDILGVSLDGEINVEKPPKSTARPRPPRLPLRR